MTRPKLAPMLTRDQTEKLDREILSQMLERTKRELAEPIRADSSSAARPSPS